MTHKKKKKVLKIFTRELKKSEENLRELKKGINHKYLLSRD